MAGTKRAAGKRTTGRKPPGRRALAVAKAKPPRPPKRSRAVVAIVGRDEAGRRAAAAGIAKEAGAALYRVDLGRLITRYIGETEKAIAAVLARIEDRNVVLFFDEADGLFGKRSDVRDAHDRYANQEVSYVFGFLRASPQVEAFADVVIRARARRKAPDARTGRGFISASG